MAKYVGKPLELLAPAGTYEIAKALLQTPCDAIYLGGPYLNMRMIRKGYNLNYQQLEAIVAEAHGVDKKVYVTLNNMLCQQEIPKAQEYLRFLESIGTDAIIIQDFAIFSLIAELGITTPLHSSVMMNIYDSESLQAVENLGVTRVVLSRECTLESVQHMAQSSSVELEYFTHGDMCIAHGAQCYYSSVLFGMSSNRGRCLKPCRWEFDVTQGKSTVYKGFPLAVKDMQMIQHLPAMVEAGITSFKIEGRMRQLDFITELITHYGNALNRYRENPANYDAEQELQWIHTHRKRDLSTSYAFGNPGLSQLNSRHEGTGALYSTGKVFSTPTVEKPIDMQWVNQKVIETFDKRTSDIPTEHTPHVTVEVQSLEQIEVAIPFAKRVYLSTQWTHPHSPLSTDQIVKIAERYPHTIWIQTPAMQTEESRKFIHALLQEKPALGGVVCSHVGDTLEFGQYGYPLHGNNTLNIYNTEAMKCYSKLGITSATLSIEATWDHAKEAIKSALLPIEVVAHGRLCVMYMDHDITLHSDNRKEEFFLQTSVSELPVKQDIWKKGQLYTEKELCLLPIKGILKNWGVSYLRILGSLYSPKDLHTILTIYATSTDTQDESLISAIPNMGKGFTLGALGWETL